jgi:ribonuclease HI
LFILKIGLDRSFSFPGKKISVGRPHLRTSLEELVGKLSYKRYRILPLLITWGVWLARNEAIFNEVSIAPEKTSLNSLAIFSSFAPSEGRNKNRTIKEVTIEKSTPWGFFDGASQQYTCGGGGLLYFSDTHYYTLTSGLGNGTNNYAELMSLKLLLAFAIEKECKKITVFGDSKNAINWINGTQRCNNIRLANIVEDIKTLQRVFDSFSCQHVYRERNEEADRASKEGTHMEVGHWKITEFLNEQIQEQQRTFL